MLEPHPATIATSSQTSSEVQANGLLIAGVITDPAMSSTSFTFYGAVQSGGPYYRISDGAGSALTKTFVAGDYVPLEPYLFAGVNFLQAKGNATEAATRTLQFMVKAA